MPVTAAGHWGVGNMSDDMLADMPAERMWTPSGDGETVRLQLPPLPIAGFPEPLRIHLDFGAEMVGEILQRLGLLRARMLPVPRRS